MRIAYVTLHWPRKYNSGVGKKISEQLSFWRAAGHEAKLFMHTYKFADTEMLLPADRIEYAVYPGMFGKLRTEAGRIKAIRGLISALKSYRPDVIYMRSAMYAYPLHEMFNIAPVILEVNTNDIVEHRHLGMVYHLYNRLMRAMNFSRAAGIVYVSRELASLPAYSKFSKPSCIIANGIDPARIRELPAPKNERPHLVFIGSPGYPWHGVDKLVPLAVAFPDLLIDVIGYEQNPLNGKTPANILFHGYLDSQAYQNILEQADAAIGSLALHRCAINEASPLKTREYLAYGLPTVFPFVDTDLNDLTSDCFLRIPNQEDNTREFGRLIFEFACQMRGRRVDRRMIMPLIDAREKEMKRLAFFDKIIGRR